MTITSTTGARIAQVIRASKMPLTIKEIAASSGLSESRVRELIRTLDDLVADKVGRTTVYSFPAPAVEETPEAGEATAKPKRRLMNPQPVIDKKRAAIEAAGGTLTFGPGRLWTLARNGNSVTIKSSELAASSAEELVALLP